MQAERKNLTLRKAGDSNLPPLVCSTNIIPLSYHNVWKLLRQYASYKNINESTL
jgi:hypothetical protein